MHKAVTQLHILNIIVTCCQLSSYVSFTLSSSDMPKSSKLLTALDRYKGKDYKLQKQKKLQKDAEKKKRAKVSETSAKEEGQELESKEGGIGINGDFEEESEDLSINGVEEGSEEDDEEDEDEIANEANQVFQ